MNRVRKKGDRYRPIVTILKTTTTKAGKTYPTVIKVSGRVYQLRLSGHTKRKRSRRRCQALLKKTTIKTRIGDPGPEIVSCYSNINGRWVWETLVWDDTKILETTKSDSVNEVMEKHVQLYEKFG